MSTTQEKTLLATDQFQINHRFSWLNASAGALGGFVVTAIAFVMLSVLLLMHGPQLLVILSSGEMTLHRSIDALWLTCPALVTSLAAYSFFVGLKNKPEKIAQLIVLWAFWTVALIGLSALWFMSARNCGIQISLNAIGMSLGLMAARPFAKPRKPEELKLRSDSGKAKLCCSIVGDCLAHRSVPRLRFTPSTVRERSLRLSAMGSRIALRLSNFHRLSLRSNGNCRDFLRRNRTQSFFRQLGFRQRKS